MNFDVHPPREFILRLPYEIYIGLSNAHATPHIRAKELFGEVWSDFWKDFVKKVCFPNERHREFYLEHPPRYSSPSPSSGRDPGEMDWAIPLHPDDLENFPLVYQDIYNVEDVIKIARSSSGPRPSSKFAVRLDTMSQSFPGELFAVAFGYAVNQQGKPQFGRVLEVELLAFEAKEGSLSSRGVVQLKFIGAALLLPLFAAAFAPPITAQFEKLTVKGNISRRLADQVVQCQVTGGFYFSRTELIERFEHRLSARGADGICEVQSALHALGYAPGNIDGKPGPKYLAAARAFAAAWGLSEHDIVQPVFFNFLARALTGERPPGK
jgi:hypothetical protein